MWLRKANCEVGENGQIGKTVWKINLKRNDTTAVSKVKPSELKTYPNQTHGGKSVFEDINIIFRVQRGCCKRHPLTVLKGWINNPFFFIFRKW